MKAFAPVLVGLPLVLAGACQQQEPAATIELPETEQEQPQSRFWHMGLVVSDLPLMHDFYTGVIGLEQATHLMVEDAANPDAEKDAILVARLQELMGLPNLKLEIQHYSDPEHQQFIELVKYHNPESSETVERDVNRPLGWNHMGFQVDSVDRVVTAMREKEMGTVLGGPTVLPEFGGNRYLFISDPEGNLIEVFDTPR